MQEQTQIRLSLDDWSAFARILDESEHKPRPKLDALIKENEGTLLT